MSDEQKIEEQKDPLQSKIEELENKLKSFEEKEKKPKELSLDEKLEQIIDEKYKEHLNSKEEEIRNARRLIEEADERRKLEEEIDTNLRYETRAKKGERLEKQFIEAWDRLARLAEMGRYRQNFFSSETMRNPKIREVADFCYMAKKLGGKKILENFKNNLQYKKDNLDF